LGAFCADQVVRCVIARPKEGVAARRLVGWAAVDLQFGVVVTTTFLVPAASLQVWLQKVLHRAMPAADRVGVARQASVLLVIVVRGKDELFQIVAALCSCGCLANFL